MVSDTSPGLPVISHVTDYTLHSTASHWLASTSHEFKVPLDTTMNKSSELSKFTADVISLRRPL